MGNVRRTALVTILVSLLASASTPKAQAEPTLEIPLTDDQQLNVEGPHRFVEVAGLTGFQPTSIHTKAFIDSGRHNSETGTISFWVSPLEDLDQYPKPRKAAQEACYFNLLADQFPPGKVQQNRFGIYWTNLYPPLVCCRTQGHIWDVLDFGTGAFAYSERTKLRRGQWYHMVHTWDKPARTLKLYINGIEVGHNLAADKIETAEDRLYIGNPMMIMRDLKITNEVLDGKTIATAYRTNRPPNNDLADQDLAHEHIPSYLPEIDIALDETWKKTYSCSFLNKEDLKGWKAQTGDKLREQFDLRITDEGLLFHTPAKIDRESRMYLWCPQVFEGDGIWIEYEFRLESPEGLALLIVYASGLQREDHITDHGLANTGSMGEMLNKYRNYHWEYMRRVCLNRVDVETQYVQKNLWGFLHSGSIERLEQDRWYTLRFVKVGNRICGSIDGKTVFDVLDAPFEQKGPVYNYGRIALRQMFYTKMRYRNLVVYEK